MVEKFLAGKDYRVLVVNNQVIAVSERMPVHVVGDGKHTVKELVDILNQDPLPWRRPREGADPGQD